MINSKFIIQDENDVESIPDECEDARLSRVLKDIANNVMEGIEMEADFPSKNQDGKLPVLDLKVWVIVLTRGHLKFCIICNHENRDVF